MDHAVAEAEPDLSPESLGIAGLQLSDSARQSHLKVALHGDGMIDQPVEPAEQPGRKQQGCDSDPDTDRQRPHRHLGEPRANIQIADVGQIGVERGRGNLGLDLLRSPDRRG